MMHPPLMSAASESWLRGYAGDTAVQRSPRYRQVGWDGWSEQWCGARLWSSPSSAARSPLLDPAPVVMRPPCSSVRFCWAGTGVSCTLELFIHTSLCQVIVPIKGCNSVLPQCGECAVVVFHGCFCFLICGGKETSLPAFFSQHLANFRINGFLVCLCYRFFDVDSFKSLHWISCNTVSVLCLFFWVGGGAWCCP